MSRTNARRHEPQLLVHSNDLITGKDCARLVRVALQSYHEGVRKDRQAAFDALPWWRRFLRGTP